MLKVTYFGTTTLLFDDGKDQILFDAHVTRPSLIKYAGGAKEKTNTALCDKLIRLHKIRRLRAVFISHTHISPLDAARRSTEANPHGMSRLEADFRRIVSSYSDTEAAIRLVNIK